MKKNLYRWVNPPWIDPCKYIEQTNKGFRIFIEIRLTYFGYLFLKCIGFEMEKCDTSLYIKFRIILSRFRK